MKSPTTVHDGKLSLILDPPNITHRLLVTAFLPSIGVRVTRTGNSGELNCYCGYYYHIIPIFPAYYKYYKYYSDNYYHFFIIISPGKTSH